MTAPTSTPALETVGTISADEYAMLDRLVEGEAECDLDGCNEGAFSAWRFPCPCAPVLTCAPHAVKERAYIALQIQLAWSLYCPDCGAKNMDPREVRELPV